MSMTLASSAYSAQRSIGSPCWATGADRVGSRAHQLRSRVEHQPLGRDSANGELANDATRTGPSALASRQRAAAQGSSPNPMLSLIAAVLHIIVRPARPCWSKYASIAA